MGYSFSVILKKTPPDNQQVNGTCSLCSIALKQPRRETALRLSAISAAPEGSTLGVHAPAALLIIVYCIMKIRKCQQYSEKNTVGKDDYFISLQTASPISEVETFVIPSVQISGVLTESSTLETAVSIASAACGSSRE